MAEVTIERSDQLRTVVAVFRAAVTATTPSPTGAWP